MKVLKADPPAHSDLPGPFASRRSVLASIASALGLAVSQRAEMALSIGSESKMEETKKVLSVVCVGAHPDDLEILGRGTLVRFAARGNAIVMPNRKRVTMAVAAPELRRSLG